MPDLYDEPKAEEFLDFDRPYKELTKEELEAIMTGADCWLMEFYT